MIKISFYGSKNNTVNQQMGNLRRQWYLFLGLTGYFICMCYFRAMSQAAGQYSFEMLRLSPSARLTALGGVNVSLYDNDINMAVQNPALLNGQMHHRLSGSFVNFLGDVGYGYVAYGRDLPKELGYWQTGIQYVNYGQMRQADEFGNQYGNFSVNELAIHAGVSRDFGPWHLGSNIRMFYSNMAGLTALGFGLDFGAFYYWQQQELGAGAVIKNVGARLKNYQPATGYNSPPFEIQAGISKKLANAPLRISLTAVNLERWDLIGKDKNTTPRYDLAGNVIPEKKSTVDNIFRHLVFGLEFPFTKNFHLRAGYNHRRRRELQDPDKGFNTRGFSFGGGFRLNRFHLDYGYGNYHAAAGVHHFTVSTVLSSFSKGSDKKQW